MIRDKNQPYVCVGQLGVFLPTDGCDPEWVIRVSRLEDITEPSRAHAYILPDNSVYVWNYNGNDVIPLTGAVWGQITGNIDDQADLKQRLDTKANLASPTISGHIAMLDNLGQYVDGNIAASDIAVKSDLANYELLENKTTIISESSTDIQYPSALAVYKCGQSIIESMQGGLKTPILINLESNLPDIDTLADGTYYIVQNMDVTAPDHTGHVWVNTIDGVKQFFKVVDQQGSPDGTTIIYSSTGSLQVNEEWLDSIIVGQIPDRLPNPLPLNLTVVGDTTQNIIYDGESSASITISKESLGLGRALTLNVDGVDTVYDGTENKSVTITSGGSGTKTRTIPNDITIAFYDDPNKPNKIVYAMAGATDEWAETINIGDYLIFNSPSQKHDGFNNNGDWLNQGTTMIVYDKVQFSSLTLYAYVDDSAQWTKPTTYFMNEEFEIINTESEDLIEVHFSIDPSLPNILGTFPKNGDYFIYSKVAQDNASWSIAPIEGEVWLITQPSRMAQSHTGVCYCFRTGKTFGISPNNIFQLGTNTGGYNYTQNSNGIIEISNRDANELIKTNSYMLIGVGKNNTPDYSKDWYIQVYAYSDAYIKQIFYCKTTDEIYQRTCNNGTWSDFKLIGGEVVIYNNTTGIGQGGSFTPSQHLSRFGSLKILLSGQPSFGVYGNVNTANRNVRASVTDITSANEQIVQVAVLTYLADLNDKTVTNARSSRQTRVASGTATNQQLNLVTVIGLP